MTCPVCGGKSHVYDSVSDCEAVFRQRKCLECNYSWYTSEYESDGVFFKEYANNRRRKYKHKRGSQHGRHSEN